MPVMETETMRPGRFELLEAAHARTHTMLEQLIERVDDHYAEANERFDQLRSDLQHVAGTNDRRFKALDRGRQEVLDHLGFLTRKAAEHDARFDRVDARFEQVEGRLDNVEARLDSVEARLDTIETRLDSLETRLDRIEVRLDQHDARFTSIESKLDEVLRRLPAA